MYKGKSSKNTDVYYLDEDVDQQAALQIYSLEDFFIVPFVLVFLVYCFLHIL